jgi:hypothetical protein
LLTVGAVKKKLKAADAAVKRATSTIESLKGDIAFRTQARDNAGLIRRWMLSSKLKSLEKKKDSWQQRYDSAKKEQARLQAQLKYAEKVRNVKNRQHYASWPAIEQAKKEGFRIS